MNNGTGMAFRIIVSVLAVAFLPMATADATTSHQPVVVSLRAYANTPLQVVQVEMGSKTVPYLFDTGGGLTTITPAAANVLGCKPFGQVTGFRADGEKMSYPRCGPVTLRLSDYATTGEVGVFDLMGMIRGQVESARKAGHEVPMPPTVGGLMGLSSFAGQPITLDFAHHRLIVETPAGLRKRVASMRPLSIRVVTEPSGSEEVFVQAAAKIGTLWMELDSGNNGPTFLAPHAIKQLGISLPDGEKKSMQLNLVGFGGVPVTVRSRAMIYDGQLGIGVISKFVWTIDLKSDRAWIKPAG